MTQVFDILKNELEVAETNSEALAQHGFKWSGAVLNNHISTEEAVELLDLVYEKFHIMRSRKEVE